MTKKQQEIQRILPSLIGKEIKLWTTYQVKFRPKDDAHLEGTVVRSTGTYLILKNVLLWNGKFFADYDTSIGSIGKMEIK